MQISELPIVGTREMFIVVVVTCAWAWWTSGSLTWTSGDTNGYVIVSLHMNGTHVLLCM